MKSFSNFKDTVCEAATEHKLSHVMKKIKAGEWEATQDVKTNRHIEVIDHTKPSKPRKTIFVREDVELDESSVTTGEYFKKHFDKAMAAKEAGDTEKFKKHYQAAKTARYGMSNAALTKHKDALDKFKSLKEEVLDEVSKETLASYVSKSFAAGNELHKQAAATDSPEEKAALRDKISKRNTGVIKAVKKIKEEDEMGIEEAKAHTIPKTDKEKKLAALADPKDKITHADVMVGRGVTKEEEEMDEMSSKEKMKRGLYNKEGFDPMAGYMSQIAKDVGDLQEKTLTPAELKKREEIATAMERENPGMPMSKKMAIATATAKKVAEAADPKEKEAPPFDPDPPKKNASATAGKFGKGYSIARHLARQGMKDLKTEEVEQIDEADQPVSVTVHYKHKDGKTNSATHFTAKNAAEHEADVKKAGGTITGRTLNYASGKKEHRSMNEDVEQIDEISKATLSSYVGKATADKSIATKKEFAASERAREAQNAGDRAGVKAASADQQKQADRADKRRAGISLAKAKMAEEFVSEGMISYMDFKDKIEAHKKAGHKVVDDKYSKDKAHFTSIDKEGIGRKLTHTASGTKVENLGKVAKVNDDEDDSNETETRGRGRPAGSKSGARRH